MAADEGTVFDSTSALYSLGAGESARLVCADPLLLDEPTNQFVIPLEGDEVTVGRAEELNGHVPSRKISRKHARLFHKEGRWWVEDLNSTNGTYVRDTRVQSPVPLAAGDTLRFSSLAFRFEVGEGKAAPSPAAVDPNATMLFTQDSRAAEMFMETQAKAETEQAAPPPSASPAVADSAAPQAAPAVAAGSGKGGGLKVAIMAVLLLAVAGGAALFLMGGDDTSDLERRAQKEMTEFVAVYERGSAGDGEAADALRDLIAKVDVMVAQHPASPGLRTIQGKLAFLRMTHELRGQLETGAFKPAHDAVLKARRVVEGLSAGPQRDALLALVGAADAMVRFKEFRQAYPDPAQAADGRAPDQYQLDQLMRYREELAEARKRHNAELVEFPMFGRMMGETVDNEVLLLDRWVEKLKGEG